MYHTSQWMAASEIGMIQMKDWRRGTSLDMGRLFLRRLKGSIGGETMLVNAAATALRVWPLTRGTVPELIFTSRNHRPISRWRLDEPTKHYCKLAGIHLRDAAAFRNSTRASSTSRSTWDTPTLGARRSTRSSPMRPTASARKGCGTVANGTCDGAKGGAK